MEQEAKAAFKKQEELDYNLICPYMDHQDKWRQAMGSELYKQTTLNISPGMRQQIGRCTNESPISMEESRGINCLLFKDGKGHLHDSWKQGFYFDDNLKYGIYQN